VELDPMLALAREIFQEVAMRAAEVGLDGGDAKRARAGCGPGRGVLRTAGGNSVLPA
jgi:hypothetical protein